MRKFFRGLFDTSFDFFISPGIFGIFYAIAVVASFVTMVVSPILAFANEDFELLQLVPGAFLFLLAVRVSFELSTALIKVAENTKPEE